MTSNVEQAGPAPPSNVYRPLFVLFQPTWDGGMQVLFTGMVYKP